MIQSVNRCLLVISHPLSMGRLEFICKRSKGPWRMLGFHEQLVFCICRKSPPLLLNYVSMAASISMATPLHHHLKLTGATPRTGKPLFCVTSPLRHTPICVLREEWGVGRVRKSLLTSRQLVSQA